MPSNQFLSALHPEDAAKLTPLLRTVRLERDGQIAEEHSPLDRLVLPINCILSVVTVMKDGRQVETRTIGCESGYGLLHALGSPISFERVIVQIGGDAYTAPLSSVSKIVRESPTLVEAVARYSQATLIQSAQSTACMALHTLEQRMCRWLLMTESRLGDDVLPLTQEHLSIMLGVQRTTITATAGGLQDRGLIAYSRGKVRLIDRAGLAKTACECHATIDWAGKIMTLSKRTRTLASSPNGSR